MYLLILNSWFLAFDWSGPTASSPPSSAWCPSAGALFFLWEFARAEGVCRVTGLDQRARIVSRLRELSRRGLTPMAILASLGIAFSVNVVEFACSIGIPQAYTKILDLNQIGLLRREPSWPSISSSTCSTTWWSSAWPSSAARRSASRGATRGPSNLIGGIIMLVLGALLLLAPERLRF